MSENESRPSAATVDGERNIRGSGEARCQRSVGWWLMGRKDSSAGRSCCDAVSPSRAANRAQGCSWQRKRADGLRALPVKWKSVLGGGGWMLGIDLEFCSQRETMRRSWRRSPLTQFGDPQGQVKGQSSGKRPQSQPLFLPLKKI